MRFQSKIHYIFFLLFEHIIPFIFFQQASFLAWTTGICFIHKVLCCCYWYYAVFFFENLFCSMSYKILSASLCLLMSTCLRLVGLYTVEGINKREYLNYGFAKAYWHVEWCRKIFILLQKLDKKSVCVLTKI